jgi:hypothetical protein
MRPTLKVLLGLAVLAVLILPGATYAKDKQANGEKPAYDHVFVIMEENTEANGILGNPNAPTFNNLATQYGLATNYYGVTHPSEPNYVATIGGDFFGIQDDNSWQVNQVDQPSLVDQLEGADLTWKGYFQNMPAPGFEGTCYPTSPCLYASKHNPFLNFTHVSTSDAGKANLVPDTQLMANLTTGNVPNFSYIVPDQCHDIHGIGGTCPDKQTNIQAADEYLATVVTAIMNSPAWKQGHNAIVVTFDEGGTTLGCCDANPGGGKIVTIVVTNNQQKAVVDDTPYNHYSLLATVEKAFGLGCLANTCDTANVKPMDKLFGLHPTPDKN